MKQVYLLTLLLALPIASAAIQIDGITTNPPVLSAGDSIDIIVEYSTGMLNDRYANPSYRFNLELIAGDEQTRNHVRITDPQGQDRFATLPAGTTRTKVFRIHIDEQAPVGEYAFELQQRWTRNGVLLEEYARERFFLPVRNAAIHLNVAEIQSTPQRVLPGTRETTITVTLANSGVREAHNARIEVTLPEGMQPSHAQGANAFVGTIPAQGLAHAEFSIDVHQDVAEGSLPVALRIVYEDSNQRQYETRIQRTIHVSSKPRLVLEQETNTLTTARTGSVSMHITNEGSVAAEAIEVRLLPESNQPINLQTRSAYIGLLGPGETRTVQLEVGAQRNAQAGEYSIPVLIRAKGDSNEQDNTIYTYRTHTIIHIEENANTQYTTIGILLLVLGAGIVLWRRRK